MKAWIDHNGHSFRLAASRLLGAPLASLFSVLVIGIAIALPTGLYSLLGNLERAAGQLPSRAEMTLFLSLELSEGSARQLAADLKRRKEVASVRFISKDEGLKGLQSTGIADVTAGLDSNPLPHAISLTARENTAQAVERLAETLRAQDGVDRVMADTEWARRMSALLTFGRDMVWMLAGILGFALAAITGNTIRLQIYALRDEIEVSRLIGATDRFVRRPFLYYGAIQGLLGGIAAWGMVSGGLVVLKRSVDTLAASYGSRFELWGLNGLEVGGLLGAATLLGYLGAFFAVSHTLRKFN